jgi:integrase
MGQLVKRGNKWWIRYYRNGKRHEESSRSSRKGVALDLLRRREGAPADGIPVTAKIGRFRFEEAAADLVTEYTVNGRRSLNELERRIEKHLQPFFGGRRMSSITTADVRTYIAQRQSVAEIVRKSYAVRRKDGTTVTIPELRRPTAGASNAEINRELTILKRMFTLAMHGGKLLHRQHVPMLEERNTRTGFFELDMLEGVLAHLPESLRPVIEFAYITGWRIPSEVLTLEWRQVDFRGGEVRLDPETTKNREGRVFPMTDDLRALLEARHTEHQRLRLKGQIVPSVSSAWSLRSVEARRSRVRFEPSPKRGPQHAALQVARAEFRTTSEERQCATWVAAESPNASRCSSLATRRAPCSTATTSCRAATSARLLRSFTG